MFGGADSITGYGDITQGDFDEMRENYLVRETQRILAENTEMPPIVDDIEDISSRFIIKNVHQA
jgi:hypothetical protein